MWESNGLGEQERSGAVSTEIDERLASEERIGTQAQKEGK